MSAAHIPGRENTAADVESRKVYSDAEWKLDSAVLVNALALLQHKPTIDLFASTLNARMACFVSYGPDPQAHAVDAFSLSWREFNFYVFPPFSISAHVL